MSKCVAHCLNGESLKESLDFIGTYAIITYELGICSWCLGRGYVTGD